MFYEMEIYYVLMLNYKVHQRNNFKWLKLRGSCLLLCITTTTMINKIKLIVLVGRLDFKIQYIKEKL